MRAIIEFARMAGSNRRGSYNAILCNHGGGLRT